MWIPVTRNYDLGLAAPLKGILNVQYFYTVSFQAKQISTNGLLMNLILS